MENGENEAIASFDTLYTNNHIQILKVLLPYFDAAIQKKMAIMIKYMEFQYTMDYFRRHPRALGAASVSDAKGASGWDIVRLFSQIKQFCTPSERAMFEQLAAMKKNMEMYEEMMNMMQLFSELSAPDGSMQDPFKPDPAAQEQSPGEPAEDGGSFDGANGGASTDFNPMEMLKSMLSPQQQSMFDMFQSAFPDSNLNQKE